MNQRQRSGASCRQLINAGNLYLARYRSARPVWESTRDLPGIAPVAVRIALSHSANGSGPQGLAPALDCREVSTCVYKNLFLTNEAI